MQSVYTSSYFSAMKNVQSLRRFAGISYCMHMYIYTKTMPEFSVYVFEKFVDHLFHHSILLVNEQFVGIMVDISVLDISPLKCILTQYSIPF